jgi:succinate dehydrogenase flavin-adding protein (antitoxin of CptAB toxin-antitoxin module)/GTP-binding protein EngB required for normal cell division
MLGGPHASEYYQQVSIIMLCLAKYSGLIPRWCASSHLVGKPAAIGSARAWARDPGTASIRNAPRRLFSSDTDFKPSEELAKERYDIRATEDIEKKRARLLYQSRKRGMLENGVILASFANKYLNKFDADQLDQYDRLINLPTNDWDIYYWATNTKPTPPEYETPVMCMLREHLKSKVSNEGVTTESDSVLGKKRPDDIIMPAKRKYYELEIDASKVDLTNYKEELFDDRKKTFKSGKAIQLMTDWRKRFFEHQLKRTISSPTSLKALDESQPGSEIYTQKVARNEIASEEVEQRNLIDSKYERAMNHHNFMQYLLSSELTTDALEYDDEAEAWADMFWHRNYGTADHRLSPSRKYRCNMCHSPLHCCDSGLKGYVPKEIFVSIDVNSKLKSDTILCQRCKFKTAYNAELSNEVSSDIYENFLKKLSEERSSLIVVLVDLTDFPASIWEGLIELLKGDNKQFLIVGNKLDLLPYDGPKLVERVNYAFRKNLARLRPGNKNLRISDTMVLSARTGYGVEGLITRILERLEDNVRNVYLVGSENSGKSTLFSALLQSDLCAIRKGDLISRVSSYQIPGHQVRMLRFPIDSVDGWQVEMRKRKTERVERNTAQRTHALSALSQRRQDSMPHMATLINRFDYVPLQSSTAMSLAESHDGDVESLETLPRFSDDHPMARIEDGEHMSASKEKFESHAFFHQTPSSCHPDHLLSILTNDERLEVFPNETIVPRKISIRPLQTIFIAGLARLDLLTSQSNVIFTIFASKYLPIHTVQTGKADQFYNQFLGSPYLGVPFGDEVRLAAWPGLECSGPDHYIRACPNNMGAADVVFSSFGWALVNLTRGQECIVRAFTPGGKGVFVRDPPLLAKANRCSTGRKIRDTPVFRNSNYIIESRHIADPN